MKKFLSALCAVFMLLCLLTPALGASPAITDTAGLFTPDEIAALEQQISDFRNETGMDFVILITDAAHSSTQERIADTFYLQGGYGLGDDFSGILYYIDMYERVPYLCPSGKMIDYMTDDRITAAHEESYNYLVYGDYAAAASQMIRSVQNFIRRGIPEDQYRYDAITGQRLTATHKMLTTTELVGIALIAGIAALICSTSVKRTYSLKGSTYDYAFRENSDVTLTERTDNYLRSTVVRTHKSPPSNSGGSSSSRSGGSRVHSSGGRSFGGGAGRKF